MSVVSGPIGLIVVARHRRPDGANAAFNISPIDSVIFCLAFCIILALAPIFIAALHAPVIVAPVFLLDSFAPGVVAPILLSALLAPLIARRITWRRT